MNIICFPHAGGQASFFHFLKKEDEINFIPYEYSGHGSRINEKLYPTFDKAVEIIAKDIVNMKLDELILFGHSMGAYIAYETAYLLENKYKKIIHGVIVSGQIAPSLHKKSHIAYLNNDDFVRYLTDMGGISDEVKGNKELLELLVPIIRSDYILLNTYHPNRNHIIQSPLYVFTGDKDIEVVESSLNEWSFFSKDFKTMEIFQGNHFYLQENSSQLVKTFLQITTKEKKDMKDIKYSWAPFVQWEVLEADKLRIANFIFKGEYTKLFPEFYNLSKPGVSIIELKNAFSQFNKQKLDKFVQKLIDTEILIAGIQQIDALFYSQEALYSINCPYDDELKINDEKLSDFKKKQLLRTKQGGAGKRIQLSVNEEVCNTLKFRKTTRIFDTTKEILFKDFSNLLACLMQRKEEMEIRYFYPSAGGLYPIDIYIYVKTGRVENVTKGIYYYDPQRHEMELISEVDIDKRAHYFQNQEIFEDSAFSIFFVYNAHSSMPKYGGMAYFYGIVEAGIIAQLLSVEGEKNWIGSCIIGEMDFRSIKTYFKLNDNEIYLMCMEFGYKK